MMNIETIRRITRQSQVRLTLAIAAVIALAGGGSGLPTGAQSNPIVTENTQAGTLDNWDVSGSGDPSIQGFASDISVNLGQPVNFKIQTDSTNWRVDIYRLGYYGGVGARKITTLGPFTQRQNQTAVCASDATTGLVDCGTWAVSATWNAAGPVSGIYVAKLTRIDNGGASHILFVVRDDNRKADIVVQTSDTTWQAYNRYGGGSLYCGGPISNLGTAYAASCATRSAKVSYNRPFDTRDHDPQSFVFNAEYPMVRWLEANGYNVKYQAGVDTDRRGSDLTGTNRPKAFISMGHDEYWSGNQRALIEAARNAGVHLAFMSGNEMYWKTRYENSIDGANTTYRTLVSYKETLASAKIDPAVDGAGKPIWTGTWRDPRFSPPADGGRPENGVTGNIWTVNSGSAAITVPASMAGMRFWRNTRITSLTAGNVATLTPESLGYEWDEDLDNGARPGGIIHLSSTTVPGVEKIVDFGASTGIGTATHSLTLYRHSSGALVFGAGTVQWSWGLDGNHDRGAADAHVPDQAIQQATVNLLADMGAQPATLQGGLTATSASADNLAPTSVITSPTGGSVQSGDRVTISGTAGDHGGGSVASVEVSVDGGATWHVAQGTAAWTYAWSPGAIGSANIRSRAIDDSGNLETAGGGVTVSIGAGSCPCTTLWKPTVTPTVLNSGDATAVEVGVKFKSDINGFITGIRYYKSTGNTGTHIGNLWTVNGTRLATAVFSGESSSGWQQVNFAAPVPITANTTYLASYHSNVGQYSIDPGYFVDAGVDSYPLHALPSNTSGGNGVFSYGASQFPTQTFNGANYWVDVVFSETVVDAPPVEISNVNVRVIDGSTATITWNTTKDATSRIDYSTDPGLPSDPTVTFTKTDPNFLMAHSMTLSGLTPMSTYYFTITAIDRTGEVAIFMAPSFAVPGPTLHDTASADFAAGTQSNTYVSETVDGEVMLKPVTGSEFTGPTLSQGWIEVPWSTEGYSIIDNGMLVVDGARVASCATDVNGNCLPGETESSTPSAIYPSPHTLEFSANFSGDQFQHAGFAQTLFSVSEPWAIFSTSNVGQLFVRTNPGGASIDTALGTSLLGALHRYKIDWKATSVDYYVDGVLVATHNVTVSAPMRPVAASDFTPFGGTVFVDWMRMTPYAASGTFLSRVFDAQSAVNWRTIQWATTTPAGTGVAISLRTGNSATPDATWSAFAPVAAPGSINLTSRYVQYRAVLTTTNTATTPSLDDIIISTGRAPVAVNDAYATNLNTARAFPASGTGSWKANDSDPDGDTIAIVGVTQPAHGTLVLNANKSATYTPNTGFNGTDTFTYTISDGLMTSTATVTMTVGEVVRINHDPVAIPDSATVLEDSTANAINVLANDNTGVDTGEVLSVTGVTQGGHGAVSFTALGVTYTPAANYTGPDSFVYTIGDGFGGVASATVSVTVSAVNDAPVAVNDSAATLEDVAVNINVLANDTDVDSGDTKAVASVTQGAKGAVTINADGTLKYTPAANANGSDTFTYKVKDAAGAVSANSATVTVTITAVNDAPSFTKGANQSVAGAGARTVANWATAISAGPADEAGQTLTFIVTNNNNALFTAQPAVAANGTLTYALGAATGSATVSVTLQDNGGTTNGGQNTSAAQTFTITTTSSVFATTTGLSVSSNPVLFGNAITLTATVVGAAGSTGIPTGTLTFKDGATTIGTAALAAGVATMSTSTLAVGTHALTAAYGGSSAFTASTSAAVSEVISASATLKVAFNVLALQDNTKKPVVKTIPVPNGLVKVFQTNNACVGNLFSSLDPKKWGRIFDGADGPGGVDGCVPVTVGSQQAIGTTDAAGNATIKVPPLALSLSNTYLVIARATNFDYVKTATSPDPLYSAFPVIVAPANSTLTVPLFLMATFNGKIVPGSQTQFFGSFLNIIQPEYMDWTEEQEQYPFVLVAEGDWDVATTVAPPSGFVPDATTLSTVAADQTTTALQFTLTDVGSDWTETGVTHVINHKGETKIAKSSVKMFNRRPTKAKADAWSVMVNSGATDIPVLHNDVVAPPKTVTVTGVTQPANGSVTFSATGVTYTPNADFRGMDTFTYSIVDSEGVESSADVRVRVGAKPNIFINDAQVAEGAKGTETAALFTVTLSAALDIPVTFDYVTHDGTAIASGDAVADYAAAAGTLEFAPGETSKTIAVPIIGDNVREPNEKFTVELLNVINASVAFGKGVGTILNDDQWPALSASDASVVEGNNAVVTVSVDGDFRDPISVDYVTVDGSAVAGVDYTATSGTLTIQPGTTSATITVPVPGDAVPEKNKTFRVRLQNPVNARLATAAAGAVTIIDDDSR